MKLTVKICVFATAFAAITCFGIADNAEAGNSWGWAKPLTEKPGSGLYTSNRKNRRNNSSSHTTSRSFFRWRTYPQPQVTTSAYQPHVTVLPPRVIVDSTTTTLIPRQPVLDNQVIHSPPPVATSPAKTPSVLDGWLVP